MNHGDIKLVIDQLNWLGSSHSDDEEVTIGSAINALETLGNQVAKQAKRIKELEEMESVSLVVTQMKKIASQAAVIEKLRDALIHIQPSLLNGMYKEEASYGKNFSGNRTDKARENVAKARKALATPTDSTQILQDWLASQINLNGYSYSINDTYVLFSVDEPPDDAYDEGSLVALYAIKKPEILK